ncbi:MAG: hypothetical protein V1761_02945 [bacterium]
MFSVQCHYLLDRRSIGFISLFTIIAMAAVFAASGASLGKAALDGDAVRQALAYRSQSAQIMRFATVLIGVFLGLHSASRAQRRPAVFFISERSDMTKFAVWKLLAAIVILITFTAVLFLFYACVGTCLTPYFQLSETDGMILVGIIDESIFFLLVQSFVTTLADSPFAAVPTVAFFWWLEANATNASENALVRYVLTIVRHRYFDLAGLASAGDPLIQVGALAILFLATVAVFTLTDLN